MNSQHVLSAKTELDWPSLLHLNARRIALLLMLTLGLISMTALSYARYADLETLRSLGAVGFCCTIIALLFYFVTFPVWAGSEDDETIDPARRVRAQLAHRVRRGVFLGGCLATLFFSVAYSLPDNAEVFGTIGPGEIFDAFAGFVATAFLASQTAWAWIITSPFADRAWHEAQDPALTLA